MMERRRVELRLIEDRTSRLARFSKRRAGLLKKARELAVLCDAEVGLIVFSPLGKHSHFSSRGSMEKTIERHQKFFETEAHLKKHARRYKSQPKRFICQTMRAGLLDVAQRLSEGGNTGNLNANDLESLKEQLDAELRRVRYRMMELTMHPINMLKEKEKALLQERGELRWALGMDVHEGEGDHRETRRFTKNGIWKKNKEGAEHCVGDGVVKADTALRLWWPPFHCG